jgi:RND family efflux transporter MFP subunit
MIKKSAYFAFWKSHQYLMIGVLVVVVLLCGFFGYRSLYHASAAPATRKAVSEQVTVASVGSLSPSNAPLSVVGEVTSENQATILAQSAGEIVTLNSAIGDRVSAGDTIAVIENSSQQASVTEAQGAYDVAEAALVKTSGGQEGSTSDGTIVDNNSAANTDATLEADLNSAYTSLDDAVHTKADTLFSNPRSANPTFLSPFNAVQYYMVDGIYPFQVAESERLSIESMLANDYKLTLATSSERLNANTRAMTSDAQTIQTFLNNMVEVVNAFQASDENNSYSILPIGTVTGYQTTIAAARTEVSSAITSLTSTLNTYDTSGVQAEVEEEQGALEAAKAALAKTYITSPISGTIVDLPITEGDYVSSNQEVAEVSNPGALKIVAHVSATDAKTLSVGNSATVNGTVQGTITEVSPAIDPETGTIEVDVALAGDQSGLTDGDSITVGLDRTASSLISTEEASSTASVIIPIVALKITPTGPEVFTVDPVKNILVPHPVEIGSILGDDIVVTSGLTPSLIIVTDARGLTDGEAVTIKK